MFWDQKRNVNYNAQPIFCWVYIICWHPNILWHINFESFLYYSIKTCKMHSDMGRGLLGPSTYTVHGCQNYSMTWRSDQMTGIRSVAQPQGPTCAARLYGTCMHRCMQCIFNCTVRLAPRHYLQYFIHNIVHIGDKINAVAVVSRLSMTIVYTTSRLTSDNLWT